MRRVSRDLRRSPGRGRSRQDDSDRVERDASRDTGRSGYTGGVDTTCFYCQEEFELDDKVVLLREGRIGFGDRTGNVTYVLDDIEENPFHPGCVGPYVSPDEENILRDIIQTEVEVNTGIAFSEAMTYYDNRDAEKEEELHQAAPVRARRGRR